MRQEISYIPTILAIQDTWVNFQCLKSMMRLNMPQEKRLWSTSETESPMTAQVDNELRPRFSEEA